jgi:hypothetical protein
MRRSRSAKKVCLEDKLKVSTTFDVDVGNVPVLFLRIERSSLNWGLEPPSRCSTNIDKSEWHGRADAKDRLQICAAAVPTLQETRRRQPRRPRSRARFHNITELEWAFLNDAVSFDDDPSEYGGSRLGLWELEYNFVTGEGPGCTERLWKAHGQAVVQRWAVEQPGTRPRQW